MRGDLPRLSFQVLEDNGSTPHARGSTVTKVAKVTDKSVYPACAGIYLDNIFAEVLSKGLPRMRGDLPFNGVNLYKSMMSTPHARGSTEMPAGRKKSCCVYPACAGIYP